MAIDMHAHFLPPALADNLRTREFLPRIESGQDGQEVFYRPFGTTPFDPSYVDIEPRIDELKRLGITTQLLSLPGLIGIDSLPLADSLPMVRIFNDSVSGLCKRYPDLFVGLAGLPMIDIDKAGEELRRGVEELGLIGAILPINCFVNRAEAEKLAPLFQIGQELKLHFFLHPGRRPDEVMPGLREAKTVVPWAGSVPTRSLKVQTDIARAAVTLLYSKFLDDYPDVTLHMSNLGGTYPMVVERIDHLSRVRSPDKPPVTEQAREIYVDCGSLGPRAVEMAVDVFGADHVLLGSDTPTFVTEWSLAAIRDAEISEAQRKQILETNALKLLRRRAT
ncbi:MAG: amidohydrolase family protein [Gammaproteobacteria bacterium]|nr:amidohydrolase family protein [Gammaproteobacteria bacterium]